MAQFATQSFTVEHIKPRAAGGETTLDNLAWACFGCNGHKQARTHAGCHRISPSC
ncbi:MAG: HNH endonuclease [Chloroflexota bacterium]